MEAILADVLERLERAVAEPIEIPALPLSRERAIDELAGHLSSRLGAVFQDEASLRVLVQSAIADESLQALLREIDDVCIDRCSETIAMGQLVGAFDSSVSPRAISLITIGALQKMTLDAFTRGEDFEVVATVRQVARVLLSGIANPDALHD